MSNDKKNSIDIEEFISSIKNNWDRDKDLRDKFENIKRDYVREKIEDVFDYKKNMKIAINYLYDTLDFEKEIVDYVNEYGNLKYAIHGILIDEILDDWRIEEEESKGQ